MGERWTKLQPRDGDTVLHCGHLDNKPHHFYALTNKDTEGNGVDFMRPDRTVGTAQWMVLCKGCFLTHAEHPEKCMRADATWMGDDPELKENIQ